MRANKRFILDPFIISPYMGVLLYFFSIIYYSFISENLLVEHYNTEKYWNYAYLAYSLLLGTTLLSGIWIGGNLPLIEIPQNPFAKVSLKPAFYFLAVTGIISGVYWLYSMREYLFYLTDPTLPSFLIKMRAVQPSASLLIQQITNFAFSLYILAFFRESAPVKKFFLSITILLFGLIVVAKSFIWTNRLQLFEMFLPPLCIYLALTRNTKEPINLLRLIKVIFNILIITFLVFLIFIGAEYLRGWRNVPIYERNLGSFMTFMINRILGYYITSQNNAAAALSMEWVEKTPFFFSLEWFWANSIISRFFPYSAFSSVKVPLTPEESFQYPLLFNLNSSYNVFGFNGYTFLDFEWWGIPFALICGLVFGYFWKLYQKRYLSGLLLYPYILLGLLELPRIVFFGKPRFIYTVLGVIMLLALLNKESYAGLKKPELTE